MPRQPPFAKGLLSPRPLRTGKEAFSNRSCAFAGASAPQAPQDFCKSPPAALLLPSALLVGRKNIAIKSLSLPCTPETLAAKKAPRAPLPTLLYNSKLAISKNSVDDFGVPKVQEAQLQKTPRPSWCRLKSYSPEDAHARTAEATVDSCLTLRRWVPRNSRIAGPVANKDAPNFNKVPTCNLKQSCENRNALATVSPNRSTAEADNHLFLSNLKLQATVQEKSNDALAKNCIGEMVDDIESGRLTMSPESLSLTERRTLRKFLYKMRVINTPNVAAHPSKNTGYVCDAGPASTLKVANDGNQSMPSRANLRKGSIFSSPGITAEKASLQSSSNSLNCAADRKVPSASPDLTDHLDFGSEVRLKIEDPIAYDAEHESDNRESTTRYRKNTVRLLGLSRLKPARAVSRRHEILSASAVKPADNDLQEKLLRERDRIVRILFGTPKEQNNRFQSRNKNNAAQSSTSDITGACAASQNTSAHNIPSDCDVNCTTDLAWTASCDKLNTGLVAESSFLKSRQSRNETALKIPRADLVLSNVSLGSSEAVGQQKSSKYSECEFILVDLVDYYSLFVAWFLSASIGEDSGKDIDLDDLDQNPAHHVEAVSKILLNYLSARNACCETLLCCRNLANEIHKDQSILPEPEDSSGLRHFAFVFTSDERHNVEFLVVIRLLYLINKFLAVYPQIDVNFGDLSSKVAHLFVATPTDVKLPSENMKIAANVTSSENIVSANLDEDVSVMMAALLNPKNENKVSLYLPEEILKRILSAIE